MDLGEDEDSVFPQEEAELGHRASVAYKFFEPTSPMTERVRESSIARRPSVFDKLAATTKKTQAVPPSTAEGASDMKRKKSTNQSPYALMAATNGAARKASVASVVVLGSSGAHSPPAAGENKRHAKNSHSDDVQPNNRLFAGPRPDGGEKMEVTPQDLPKSPLPRASVGNKAGSVVPAFYPAPTAVVAVTPPSVQATLHLEDMEDIVSEDDDSGPFSPVPSNRARASSMALSGTFGKASGSSSVKELPRFMKPITSFAGQGSAAKEDASSSGFGAQVVVEDLEDDDECELAKSAMSPITSPPVTQRSGSNFWGTDIPDRKQSSSASQAVLPLRRFSLKTAAVAVQDTLRQEKDEQTKGDSPKTTFVSIKDESTTAESESDDNDDGDDEGGSGSLMKRRVLPRIRSIVNFGAMERRNATHATSRVSLFKEDVPLSFGSFQRPTSRSAVPRARIVSVASPGGEHLLPSTLTTAQVQAAMMASSIVVQPNATHAPPVIVPALTAAEIAHQAAIQAEIDAKTRDATKRILRDFFRRWAESVAVTIVVILFLFYPTLLLNATEMLRCASYDYGNGATRTYLIADRSIDCLEAKYHLYSMLGYVALVGYGLGIPVVSIGLVKLIAAMHDGDSDHARKLFFFTTGGFKEELWFWDTVGLLRKATLVVVTSLITPDLAGLLCAWAMAGFLALNLITSPWANSDLSRLENTSLATITATFSLVLLLPHYTFETAPVLNTMIALGILIVNCFAFAVFAAALKTEFVFAVKSILSKFPQLLRFAEIIGAIDTVEQVCEHTKKLEERVDTERRILHQRHVRSTILLAIIKQEEAGAIEEELAWTELDQDIRNIMPQKLQDLQVAIQREVADEMKLIDKKLGIGVGIVSRNNASFREEKSANSLVGNSSNASSVADLRRCASGPKDFDDDGIRMLGDITPTPSSKRLKELPSLQAARGTLLFRSIVQNMLNPKNLTTQLPLKAQIGSAKLKLVRTTFAVQVEIEEMESKSTSAEKQIEDTRNATDAIEHLFETEVDIARKLLMSFRLRHALAKARRQVVLFM